MKNLFLAAVLVLVPLIAVCAQHDHEYAPLTEKDIDYRNWTYRNVKTNKKINLREFTRDKKLVMVFYFAPWCHSSNYQAPVTQKLYEKYKEHGFAVIGVSLYGSIARVEDTMKKKGMEFPVVSESVSSKDRKKTLHYNYRQKTGDYRKWGTPWNIFLVSSEVDQWGEILATRAVVVNGEIREKEAEKYIREKLGLPALETKPKKEKPSASN